MLALHDRKSGEAVGRYTTKTVRRQERRALADAATIASGSAKRVSASAKADTLQSRQLRPDHELPSSSQFAAAGLRSSKVAPGRERASRSLRSARRTSAMARR